MTKRPAKPIPAHAFHGKTVTELLFIARDAGEAARALRGEVAEGKYLDQVNDACSVMYYRANLIAYAEARI